MQSQDKAKQAEAKKNNVKEQAVPEPLNLSEQDQNVAPDGFCTMAQDGEMARANSGGECDEA